MKYMNTIRENIKMDGKICLYFINLHQFDYVQMLRLFLKFKNQ